MRISRSGLIALVSLGCLLIGTVAAQAATPSSRHATGTRATAPEAGGYDGYGKPPGGSLPEFRLTVTNNSTQFQDLTVYQKADDLGVPNVLPLAWLVAPAWPQTTVTFTWTEQYGFVWSQTGPLRPGVTFKPQQTVDADPQDANTNHTRFESTGGSFNFVPDANPGPAGTLTIREAATVPPDTASVGLSMSNGPIFAVQAQPNTNLVFRPIPNYWITAGTFEAGAVIDPEQITNEAQLPFQGSTRSLTAVLDASNVWHVSPGAA
jgi:rhizosphere induced protein